MFVLLSPTFVADTKIFFVYNFVVPLFKICFRMDDLCFLTIFLISCETNKANKKALYKG